MRITNDNYSPIQLLAEIMARPGLTSGDTAEFKKPDYNNHHWLTERWNTKLEVILECFQRYKTLSAETQCVQDKGVDVLLQYERDGQTNPKIGFQIKSNQEADRDRTKNISGKPYGKSAKKGSAASHSDRVTMIGTLKRQAFESQEWHLTEWWVVPCFSYAEHRSLVAAINTELTKGEHRKGIRVVSPVQALTFLTMPDDEIMALCSRFLCADDEVLRSALREMNGLSPMERAIVLETLGAALEGERRCTQDDIFGIVSDYLDEGIEIHDAVDRLEGMSYLSLEGSDDFIVSPTALTGMCALYFEARVRHGRSPDGATRYIDVMTKDL